MRGLDGILVHTCTNMATMQLHRTAAGLVQQHSAVPFVSAGQSQDRVLPAAERVLHMFRAAGDGIKVAIRNPCLSLAAYMAASTFLEASQTSGPVGDETRRYEESLTFLARLLVFFGRTSPLTRAMAHQLALDMKQTGYDSSVMDEVCGHWIR